MPGNESETSLLLVNIPLHLIIVINMIWLASFPRSGNTFFRNVLYEVYGIKSSTYHQDPARPADADFADFPVVKTHLLPGRLPAELRDRPAVYLIRDGRDALVSIAHHRKDIVAPGTDFYNNLLEAILAQNGSFFGGWSENVRQWTARAAVVIRFEDLIADPIREVEKLRKIMDLPPPDVTKLPTFQSLREGRTAYGGGKGDDFNPDQLKKHFRSGKTGGWRQEVSPELIRLLLRLHGKTLQKAGYVAKTDLLPPTPPRRVLIEASKLLSTDNDGVTRYLAGLRWGLYLLAPSFPHLEVSLVDRFGTVRFKNKPAGTSPAFNALTEKDAILQDGRTMGYEKGLLLLKYSAKKVLPALLYEKMAGFYREGPVRRYLSRLQHISRTTAGRLSGTSLSEALATADLIHFPLPQHFSDFDLLGKNALVTVHDLSHRLFPAYHEANNVALAEQGLQSALAANADLISVSTATRNDLLRFYQPAPEKIHCIPESADTSLFQPAMVHSSRQPVLQRYNIPSTPFFLCLSTIEPRKNLGGTVRSFLRMKADHPEIEANLVICGKRGWKTEEVFAGLPLDRPDLVFTGFVDDAHLPALCTRARALCYISHYEGFGLPILEAMACRTPVIYGNNSSMPEVGGDGGIPVDADDEAAIAAAMYRLLTDDEFHAGKAEAAWRQANKFSWLKTALLTLDLYDRLTQNPS